MGSLLEEVGAVVIGGKNQTLKKNHKSLCSEYKFTFNYFNF